MTSELTESFLHPGLEELRGRRACPAAVDGSAGVAGPGGGRGGGLPKGISWWGALRSEQTKPRSEAPWLS